MLKRKLADIKEITALTRDILRGVNATIWGGKDGVKKVEEIVKSGVSGADIVIGTSHALEDFACNDPVCGTLDVIGSISSAVGLVIGNIPCTKRYTKITGSVTVGCRSVRYYCRTYGTYWGCVAAIGEGVKQRFKIPK